MPSSASICTTMSAPLSVVPASGCAGSSVFGCNCAFMLLSSGIRRHATRLSRWREQNRVRAAASADFLQGRCCWRRSGSRIQPRHARAQCRADLLDLMVEVGLLVGLVVRQSGGVFGGPFLCERAVLDLLEHLAH